MPRADRLARDGPSPVGVLDRCRIPLRRRWKAGWSDHTERWRVPSGQNRPVYAFDHSRLSEHFADQPEGEAECHQRDLRGDTERTVRVRATVQAGRGLFGGHVVQRFFEYCFAGSG